MRASDPVRLGRTPLTVSRLGLGTAWLGNLYQAVEERATAAVLDRALELGIRLIDTAPYYGLGMAERRIGPLLAARPRDSFVLSTKVGRVLRPRAPGDPQLQDEGRPLFVGAPPLTPGFDFSYDATLRSVAGSLERLGLDRVDMLLIHDPDDHFPEALDGAYRALERLCAERGVAVVIGGVYNTGILADPSPGTLYNYRAATPEALDRARRIQAVCERHGVPLKAAAIQFPFGHPAVASVLTGVRSVAELDDNAAMLEVPIPAELWEDLRARRLLSADYQ